MPNPQEIESYLLSIAPGWCADGPEKPGLQIALSGGDVPGVIVALDLTGRIITEAVRLECRLIVTHHPLIYQPMSAIIGTEPEGRLVADICKRDLNLICLHTNWDCAQRGLNGHLAELLSLRNVQALDLKEEKLFKLVVFVPRGYEDKVRESLCRAGAGWIGNYSFCTFQTEGTGTFLPLAGTKPFIGREGRLEKAREYRLETILKEAQISPALNAMRAAHPYEEVAYDLYPLANPGIQHGLGRVGELEKRMAWSSFLDFCRTKLQLSELRWKQCGSHIKKVAVCGGKGGGLILRTVKAGADVLITGDVTHHDWLKAEALGLSLIDAGHGGLEKWFVPQVASLLRERFQGLRVFEAAVEPLWSSSTGSLVR
ncbi:MAG: Nif3-like dinuclear metal center hexameric protein [Bacillota bacterium]